MENNKTFKEAHKPIHVPAHFDENDWLENKIIYVLGQLEEASANEIGFKLAELENSDDVSQFQNAATKHLAYLYKEGLVKGIEGEEELRFNLSKIERPNSGKINPDLLDENLT
jgi:hypothetical protein